MSQSETWRTPGWSDLGALAFEPFDVFPGGGSAVVWEIEDGNAVDQFDSGFGSSDLDDGVGDGLAFGDSMGLGVEGYQLGGFFGEGECGSHVVLVRFLGVGCKWGFGRGALISAVVG